MAASPKLDCTLLARTSSPARERRLPCDPDALGELLRSLEPRLVAVAMRVTRDAEAARDVVQSAFEKALKHARRFRGHARVSTWLHRIVVNEALMWLRSERRHRRRLVELEGAEPGLADPAPPPDELLWERQRTARLREGLLALRHEERQVLKGCALGGHSYAELGRLTGTHPAALKSRAFRARQQLSALLR